LTGYSTVAVNCPGFGHRGFSLSYDSPTNIPLFLVGAVGFEPTLYGFKSLILGPLLFLVVQKPCKWLKVSRTMFLVVRRCSWRVGVIIGVLASVRHLYCVKRRKLLGWPRPQQSFALLVPCPPEEGRPEPAVLPEDLDQARCCHRRGGAATFLGFRSRVTPNASRPLSKVESRRPARLRPCPVAGWKV
jgi:hypothetical protein